MQKAQRLTESSLHGRISLTLSKDGSSSNQTSVPDNDLDIFINADYDELCKTQTIPQPQVHVDGKDFLNYIKHDRESKERDHQYS
jgi:hypothetical protein